MSEPNPEYENFDKVMSALLAVPYTELQEKLKEHKEEKTKRKRAKQHAASRASKGSS